MAHTYAEQQVSYTAGAVIAFGQVVKLNGDTVVPCNAAGEKAFGIASCDAEVGDNVSVVIGGVGKAKFGAVLATGVSVTTNANGLIVAANSGSAVLGEVAFAAGVNEIGSILVDKA